MQPTDSLDILCDLASSRDLFESTPPDNWGYLRRKSRVDKLAEWVVYAARTRDAGVASGDARDRPQMAFRSRESWDRRRQVQMFRQGEPRPGPLDTPVH